MPVVTTDLVKAVGALLDVDVTANTVPDTDQVEAWLFQGALKILEVLPVEKLSGFMDNVTNATCGEDWNLDSGIVSAVRIVTVLKGGYVCKKITFEQMMELPLRAPNLFTDTYGYAEFGIAGQSSLKFYPTTTASATIHFVSYPTATSTWIASPTSEYVPPTSWGQALVEYAVMMGKIQDEEPEQAQMMMQIWMQSIQGLNAGSVGTGEVGK